MREHHDSKNRPYLREIWTIIADMLGGDGWEDWTDDQVCSSISDYMIWSGDSHQDAQVMVDDGFDPRHVKGN